MYAVLLFDVVHFRDQWHFISAYKIVREGGEGRCRMEQRELLLSSGVSSRLTTTPLLHTAKSRNFSYADLRALLDESWLAYGLLDFNRQVLFLSTLTEKNSKNCGVERS